MASAWSVHKYVPTTCWKPLISSAGRGSISILQPLFSVSQNSRDPLLRSRAALPFHFVLFSCRSSIISSPSAVAKCRARDCTMQCLYNAGQGLESTPRQRKYGRLHLTFRRPAFHCQSGLNFGVYVGCQNAVIALAAQGCILDFWDRWNKLRPVWPCWVPVDVVDWLLLVELREGSVDFEWA